MEKEESKTTSYEHRKYNTNSMTLQSWLDLLQEQIMITNTYSTILTHFRFRIGQLILKTGRNDILAEELELKNIFEQMKETSWSTHRTAAIILREVKNLAEDTGYMPQHYI